MAAVWPLVLIASAGGPAQPSATIRELGHALTRCFEAPPRSEGSQITVRFSLRRDGTVFGKARITYSRLVGAADDQALFARTVAASLDACTPVSLDPGFGAVIAGKPLTILFSGARPSLSFNNP